MKVSAFRRKNKMTKQKHSLRCGIVGVTRSLMLIVSGFLLISTLAVSVRAQYPSGVKQILSDRKQQPMTKLTGVIRVPKSFGVVPMGPGHSQPAVYPCMPFGIAVYDAKAMRSKPLVVMSELMTQGRDQEEFYTCKYEVSAPSGIGLYVIPVMGGTLLLPKEQRMPMHITDAWIGGTNSKPRRGWERGFVGKFLTLGTRTTYLKFDLGYAQVDPN
jgi:hypothetical protein